MQTVSLPEIRPHCDNYVIESEAGFEAVLLDLEPQVCGQEVVALSFLN